MAFGDKTKKFQAERATAEEMATPSEATAVEPTPVAGYSMSQLMDIVAAGMPVADARALLDDGFAPDKVLELAVMQASQRVSAAADVQTATAKAMQKAMKPENDTHPGISDFSYPEGDVARPRPMPPFEFWMNGYPCTKFPETQHWRELELMCEVRPGNYTVMRKDFSTMKVDVVGSVDAGGNLTRVDVNFPITREERGHVPPMTVLLYQLVKNDNPSRRFLEAMQEHLQLRLGASAALAMA
jgi:hypothetical protein